MFTIGGVPYTWNRFIVLLFTIPVLLALMWLVQRTRHGKAMRATAQDREAAAMMGISVNRTISFTFFLAGSLAGAAALLYALYITNIRYTEGFRVGLIAFTAAVLGGIGNLPGAVLGGLVIGFVESFNNGLGWHAPGSDWTQSIIFAILILILVFRPEGPPRRADSGGRVVAPGIQAVRDRTPALKRQTMPRAKRAAIVGIPAFFVLAVTGSASLGLIVAALIFGSRSTSRPGTRSRSASGSSRSGCS